MLLPGALTVRPHHLCYAYFNNWKLGIEEIGFGP